MSNFKSPTVVDIPFADEEEQPPSKVNGNSNSSDNDSRYKRTISERKGANLRLIIGDGDDSDSETERRDKPGPLISDLCANQLDAPAMGLRRNSFSMPALNEVDLDALRALHMNAMEGEESEDIEKSNDSLNEITVSEKFEI